MTPRTVNTGAASTQTRKQSSASRHPKCPSLRVPSFSLSPSAKDVPDLTSKASDLFSLVSTLL